MENKNMCQTLPEQPVNHCAPNSSTCLNKCSSEVKKEAVIIIHKNKATLGEKKNENTTLFR